MAMSVAWAGGDTDQLIVAGGGAAARSADGGRDWEPLDVPEGTMVVAAAGKEALYAARLEGSAARISVSVDDGRSWKSGS